MVRDRRVLNGALVMPVLTIALVMMLIGSISSSVRSTPNFPMAIVGAKDSLISQAIVRSETSKTRQVETVEEGIKLLRRQEIALLIEILPTSPGTNTNGQLQVIAHYNEGDTLSMMAVGAFRGQIQEVNSTKLKLLLQERGIDPAATEAIQLATRNVEKGSGLGSSTLIGLIPYLVVLWAFYGGMSIVADLVAGEKEKGTLETLLVSPVRRIELAWGKILALGTICLASALTNVVAILLVGAIGLPVTKELFPNGVQIQLGGAVAVLVMLIPLVAFFAGVMVSISALAKSMRECQTYLTVASFLVLLPAIFSQFADLTGLNRVAWVLWTPILNTSLAMRSALAGNPNWLNIGIAATSSLVLAGLFLAIAISLFNREEIVNRS